MASNDFIPPQPVTKGIWQEAEHERFLEAMKMFPRGPWRSIAAFIGTRSIKQVQTHAQKYQQKIHRRQRGLRKQKKKFVRLEHRVDQNATGRIIREKSVGMPPSPTHSIMPSKPTMMNGTSPTNVSDINVGPTSSFSSLLNSAPISYEFDHFLSGMEPLPFVPMTNDQYFSSFNYPTMQESLELLLP